MSDNNNPDYVIGKGPGALRIGLLLVVLICVPFSIWSGERGSTWGILAEYVIPALVILLAWGLLLDILMGFVFRAGRPEAARHYTMMILFDLFALGLLLWAWLPFYLRLMGV